MDIKKAELIEGKLVLTTEPAEALKFVYSFKEGNYDIVKHVEKRSRNINAYCWMLIGKIAQKLAVSPVDVYRHAIENIGGISTVVTVRSNAVKDFTKAFVNGHIGRNVELLDDDGQLADLLITYGSSDYDNKQMTQLVDSIVQDCIAMGIETKDQGYIDSLLEDWQNG